MITIFTYVKNPMTSCVKDILIVKYNVLFSTIFISCAYRANNEYLNLLNENTIETVTFKLYFSFQDTV